MDGGTTGTVRKCLHHILGNPMTKMNSLTPKVLYFITYTTAKNLQMTLRQPKFCMRLPNFQLPKWSKIGKTCFVSDYQCI